MHSYSDCGVGVVLGFGERLRNLRAGFLGGASSPAGATATALFFGGPAGFCCGGVLPCPPGFCWRPPPGRGPREGLAPNPVEGVGRLRLGSGAPSRFPGARLISSSLSSSHSASVRWLSGIASSSCRRRRGEVDCGAFIFELSHRSGVPAPVLAQKVCLQRVSGTPIPQGEHFTSENDVTRAPRSILAPPPQSPLRASPPRTPPGRIADRKR